MRWAICLAALARFGCIGAMPEELFPKISACADPIECGADLFIGFQQYGPNIGEMHPTSHNSPADCCSLCGKTTGCKGFVWTNDTATFSLCVLKSTDGSPVETPGVCTVYGRMRVGTTTSTSPLTSAFPTTLTTSLEPAPSPPEPTPVPTPAPVPTPSPGLSCDKVSGCRSQIFIGMVELDGALVDGTDASPSDHASPTECCDYCAATAGCVAWFWTNGTIPPNLCYLKKELKSPQPSEECNVYGVLKGTNNQHRGPGVGGILAAVCGVLILLLILILIALWALRRRKESRESLDSFGPTVLSRPFSEEVSRAGVVAPQQSNAIASVPQASSPPLHALPLPSTGHLNTAGIAAVAVPPPSTSRRGSVDLATSIGAAREEVRVARAAAAASKVAAGADPLSLDPSYTERLREVQHMLDDADPDEIVGLAIQVYGEKAVVVERIGGRFRAALDSGGELMLEKIEAIHVVDWLDG